MKRLKIISFYNNEKVLIRRAISGHPNAQRAIYEKFSPKMLGICRQYIRDLQYAEDVMINGFVKVFNNLSSFKHEGSFEGWIRQIMVREAISYLRKKQFVVFDDEVCEYNTPNQITISSTMDIQYIQQLIDDLPEGYKMVFVLYAIEGYKHSEIAEMLDITEGTSKSQLFKARRMLQEKLKEQRILGYGTH